LAKRSAVTPGPSTRGFRWTGHLFQGLWRGGDGQAAPLGSDTRIALDPVVAGLARHAGDRPWSSPRAHLAGEDDELATVAPLRALIPDFAALLTAAADPATTARIEWRRTTGRPLGAPEWIAALEQRPGPPSHPANPAQSRERTVRSSGSRRCCKFK
jgi:putative transposase